MFINKGENIAVWAKGKTVTYNVLGGKISKFSSLYKTTTTSKVGIFSENRLGWIYSFYAAWDNGAVAVPIDFMSTVSEVAYILNDCKPEVVFVSSAKKGDLEEALKETEYRPDVFVIDEYEDSEGLFEDFPLIDPDLEKTAVIIYTSGTTGNPKGVMLSYQNLLSNIHAVSRDVEIYKPTDTILMLLPLHHILPLLGTMVLPIFNGAKIALSPSMASEDIIKTLQQCKVTILIGVPRLYAAIHKGISDKISKSAVARTLFKVARAANSKAFSKVVFGAVHKKFGGHVRHMVSGGAALDKEIGEYYETLGFEVLEGYGMTEAAPMITFTRPGKVKIGSPGFLLPSCQVEIREGEIVAKGKNIMQGYYNRPQETAEVLKDGWLYTGDLGHFDEEGYLHITGRKKEILILSNGKNINPVEIEYKLERYAAFVKEVGVYQSGDQFKAIVVPSDELSLNCKDADELYRIVKKEVIEDYNKQCASYKKVMDITVLNGELPRTRLGKIRRFKLAGLESHQEIEEQVPVTVDMAEFNIVAKYLEEEKRKKVLPDHHLELDLGLDSLDKVSFQVFLNSTFGVDVDPGELVRFNNILSLCEYLHENRKKMEVEKVDWTKILKEKVHISLPRTWFTGRLLVKISKYFFSLYFGLKGKGLKNIPDEPCIIAPNHQSYFDGLFVASFLKSKMIKNTYFYAKEKHVSKRWLKFVANRNHVIVMDLNKDLKESIQKLGEALRKKKNLIIFPEGTRTKNGNLGDFKKTFAILSRELNVPVVPVSIKGAYDALPKGSKFPKPFKKVMVEFLEPVMPGADTYDNIRDAVYNKIAKTQLAIKS
ncbi:AMP-binding protein [Plebeiibacterium marinum]|uniref:AMP-binding protein n=1 Tax=Plebeiibacterium marinum TaxID=2992111 RepID=A0AAE3MBS6_9BACT|nr:AMP-binding protein [Plebeiobacterium marinum]MCW3804823.1 AMP-binding protein [Plebeiobacterium marinum]